jgi:hypothetical protein
MNLRAADPRSPSEGAVSENPKRGCKEEQSRAGRANVCKHACCMPTAPCCSAQSKAGVCAPGFGGYGPAIQRARGNMRFMRRCSRPSPDWPFAAEGRLGCYQMMAYGKKKKIHRLAEGCLMRSVCVFLLESSKARANLRRTSGGHCRKTSSANVCRTSPPHRAQHTRRQAHAGVTMTRKQMRSWRSSSRLRRLQAESNQRGVPRLGLRGTSKTHGTTPSQNCRASVVGPIRRLLTKRL